MSQIMSFRLSDETARWLKHYAERTQRSLSEAGALALEEWRRQNEFAYIEFRATPSGERRACLKGSTLAVWEVIQVARDYDMDAERTAAHFGRPKEWAQAALNYYAAYPQEIDRQIEYNDSMTFEMLRRRLPGLQRFEVPRKALQGDQEP